MGGGGGGGVEVRHAPSRGVPAARRDWSGLVRWVTDEVRAEVGVVFSFGYLLPVEVLEAFPKGVVNVHPSLLPKYRGPNPIEHAVLNGDRETGVSIIEVRPHRFDEGEVLAQERVAVGEDETVAQLGPRLTDVGLRLLEDVLEDLDAARATRRVTQDQLGGAPSKAPKLPRSARFLRIGAAELQSPEPRNQLRAFGEVVFGVHQLGKPIPMLPVAIVEMLSAPPPNNDDALTTPGDACLTRDGSAIAIRVSPSLTVYATRLRPAGSRICTAKEFCNGYLRARPGVVVRGVVGALP